MQPVTVSDLGDAARGGWNASGRGCLARVPAWGQAQIDTAPPLPRISWNFETVPSLPCKTMSPTKPSFNFTFHLFWLPPGQWAWPDLGVHEGCGGQDFTWPSRCEPCNSWPSWGVGDTRDAPKNTCSYWQLSSAASHVDARAVSGDPGKFGAWQGRGSRPWQWGAGWRQGWRWQWRHGDPGWQPSVLCGWHHGSVYRLWQHPAEARSHVPDPGRLSPMADCHRDGGQLQGGGVNFSPSMPSSWTVYEWDVGVLELSATWKAWPWPEWQEGCSGERTHC